MLDDALQTPSVVTLVSTLGGVKERAAELRAPINGNHEVSEWAEHGGSTEPESKSILDEPTQRKKGTRIEALASCIIVHALFVVRVCRRPIRAQGPPF